MVARTLESHRQFARCELSTVTGKTLGENIEGAKVVNDKLFGRWRSRCRERGLPFFAEIWPPMAVRLSRRRRNRDCQAHGAGDRVQGLRGFEEALDDEICRLRRIR